MRPWISSKSVPQHPSRPRLLDKGFRSGGLRHVGADQYRQAGLRLADGKGRQQVRGQRALKGGILLQLRAAAPA